MLLQLILNSVIAASVYALVAVGFALIYNTVRFFHFAHAGVLTAAAYFTFAFKEIAGLSIIPASILGLIAATLLGMAIELWIYRPLRGRRATALTLLIASLGILIIVQNGISLVFGDNTKSIRSGITREGLNVFGARISAVQLATLAVSITLTLCVGAILKYTDIGRRVRAVANDSELAAVCGIDSERVLLFTLGTGSALAAVAAILIGLDTDITPMMGFHALLMALVAVIAGGVRSIAGIALGSLLIGLAQHIGVWKLPTQWQDAIAFIVLVFFLTARPQGFSGAYLRTATV